MSFCLPDFIRTGRLSPARSRGRQVQVPGRHHAEVILNSLSCVSNIPFKTGIPARSRGRYGGVLQRHDGACVAIIT